MDNKADVGFSRNISENLEQISNSHDKYYLLLITGSLKLFLTFRLIELVIKVNNFYFQNHIGKVIRLIITILILNNIILIKTTFLKNYH